MSLMKSEVSESSKGRKRTVGDMVSEGKQKAQGFPKLVCRGCFAEPREAFVLQDVFFVAGQHELLCADFDHADMAVGGGNFDFVEREQVAGFCGQGAEAVNPLSLQVIGVIHCKGLGQLRIACHARARGFYVCLGQESPDELPTIGTGGQ